MRRDLRGEAAVEDALAAHGQLDRRARDETGVVVIIIDQDGVPVAGRRGEERGKECETDADRGDVAVSHSCVIPCSVCAVLAGTATPYRPMRACCEPARTRIPAERFQSDVEP